MADRAKHCIERYWEVVGVLSIVTNPNLITIPRPPKLGISKDALMKLRPNGDRLQTEQHVELICVV